MSVSVYSAVTFGLQVVPVTIEAALGNGFSGVQILGLPQEYSRDARERIRAALEGLGLNLPARRLIISVRPSEILKNFKTGLEHLDIACAMSVLAALAEQSSPPRIASVNLKKVAHELARHKHYFAGQLSLAGEILPLSTSLPFEILALQHQGPLQLLWCNPSNIQPDSQIRSCLSESTTLHGCLQRLTQHNFDEVIKMQDSQTQQSHHRPHSASSIHTRKEKIITTISQFEHSPSLAFALTLAAAGKHHILLAGSPGCGKTFALRALQRLLPPLSLKEKMDIALIHNRDPHEILTRPFRSPHHSASSAALLGGSLLQPGEVSLAHHGALFLDELAEFPRPSLEALREPLDEKKISLARARGRIELPADFMLAAATNPCACGYVFSRHKQCRCPVGAPVKYQQKLSGPLLERFSIMLLIDDLMDTSTSSEDLSSFYLPASARLKTCAQKWYAAFKSAPDAWVEHFVLTQEVYWAHGHDLMSQSAEIRLALKDRALKKKWSPRTVQRISQLTQTLSTLLPQGDELSLSNEDNLSIAEELRGLEITFQRGVHLLTPRPSLIELKKMNQNNDIPGGVV